LYCIVLWDNSYTTEAAAAHRVLNLTWCSNEI